MVAWKWHFFFCCARHLHILNDGATPTYRRRNTESFIDVIVCNFSFVADGLVKESFSDHSVIITKIRDLRTDPVLPPGIYLTRKLKTQNVRCFHYEAAAIRTFKNCSENIAKLFTVSKINNFTQEIALCNSYLVKLSCCKPKNGWWSPELTALRKRLLAAQRRYKRSRCTVLKRIISMRTRVAVSKSYSRPI